MIRYMRYVYAVRITRDVPCDTCLVQSMCLDKIETKQHSDVKDERYHYRLVSTLKDCPLMREAQDIDLRYWRKIYKKTGNPYESLYNSG